MLTCMYVYMYVTDITEQLFFVSVLPLTDTCNYQDTPSLVRAHAFLIVLLNLYRQV
jgi:hypothetical protein